MRLGIWSGITVLCFLIVVLGIDVRDQHTSVDAQDELIPLVFVNEVELWCATVCEVTGYQHLADGTLHITFSEGVSLNVPDGIAGYLLVQADERMRSPRSVVPVLQYDSVQLVREAFFTRANWPAPQ